MTRNESDAITRKLEAASVTAENAGDIVDVLHREPVLGTISEAQLMAACAKMRADLGNDETFTTVVASTLAGKLEPTEALAMAETWDIASRQAALRTLAMDDPYAAIGLVGRFAEVAGPEHLRTLGADDPGLEEIIATAPRKRMAKLVALRPGQAGPPAPEEPDTSEWNAPDPVMTEMERIGERLHALANAVDSQPRDAWDRAQLDRLHDLAQKTMAELQRVRGTAARTPR